MINLQLPKSKGSDKQIASSLTSRGGSTAIAYTPTGKLLQYKRCKEVYTHVVLTQHKKVDIGDYGWFKWCTSLEEATICKEKDVWNSEASWGFIDVIIVECKMVNPWEIESVNSY